MRMAPNTHPSSNTPQNSTSTANSMLDQSPRVKAEPNDGLEQTNSQQPPNPSTEVDPTVPMADACSATIASPHPCTSSQAEKRKADAQGGSDEKRQKNSPERFMQHPRFWFPDGNVQVQIGPIRFNLHRSRLVTSSAWFKKHFEERDTKEIEDGLMIVDGSDLIELDATGIDVGDFVRLLIATEDIVDYHHSPPPFATIASILRAASILEFPKFRSYARGALEALFPDSLDAVGAATVPHAAEAIVLARAWDLPKVLKRAFYELARSPPSAATTHALSLLFLDDVILVAQAQKHLAAVWSAVTSMFPGCGVCIPNPKSITAKSSDLLWFMPISNEYRFDPIMGLAMLPQAYAKQNYYCLSCARLREKVWKRYAIRIWTTDLDVWFGLGDAN